MERQTVKSKKGSQRDKPIKVSTNWRHTDEASPAFKRLMMLLLKERIGNGEKATERESNRPNY